MRTFKDKHGHDWSISLDIPTLERISKLPGLDRAKVLKDPAKFIEELMGDEFLLGDALHSACLDQCQLAGLTAEQFAAQFNGESLQQACEVFLEEYVDFFRDPVKRTGLKRVLEKTKVLQAKAMAMVEARLSDPRTDAMLSERIETLGKSFTDSLARSGSASADSPPGT